MRTPAPLDALPVARATVRALGKRLRAPLDFYETNADAVAALRARVRITGRVFEPCNGLSAISRHFADCVVRTNDIDPRKPADTHVDAAEARVLPGESVVTNTPFGAAAFPIVRNFVEQGAPCYFLELLSFLEPTFERGDWLQAHPPVGQIVLPRYSYTGDGKTFQVTCAWLLWNTAPLVPAIQIVSKGPPRAKPGDRGADVARGRSQGRKKARKKRG